MRTTPRPVDRILYSGSAALASVTAHATYLQRIQSALESILPPEAAANARVAAFDSGCLTLITSSGAWATRLRYQRNQMARVLAQKLRLDVSDLQVRVRPAVYRPQTRSSVPRLLSQRTRRLLADTAEHIDDPPLAAAISRLGAAGNRRS